MVEAQDLGIGRTGLPESSRTASLSRVFRAFAWILVTSIVSLSLVPPSLRPVTGAPHDLEHFAIFALCGYAFGLGYSSRYLLCAISLVIFAGLVEILQLAAPGRHARMVDFAVDAVASCAGVLIGWMTLKQMLAEGVPSPAKSADHRTPVITGMCATEEPKAVGPKWSVRSRPSGARAKFERPLV